MVDIEITPAIAAAAQALLAVYGDPKKIGAQIDRWDKAVEDAKAHQAAADVKEQSATQRIEKANAAERAARAAQADLGRLLAAHKAAVEAHNAKAAQDASNALTARVMLEQREAALKAAENALGARAAKVDEDEGRVQRLQQAADAMGARYATAIAKLGAIVKEAGA